MWLTERKKDPADVAYEMVTNADAAKKMIDRQVDDFIKALEKAGRDAAGHKKFGGEHLAAMELIQGAPLREAKALVKLASDIVAAIEGLKESFQVAEALDNSCSRAAFEDNIATEIKAGKDRDQAVAIAVNVLKKACGVTSDKRMSVDEILKGGAKEAEETRRAGFVEDVVYLVINGYMIGESSDIRVTGVKKKPDGYYSEVSWKLSDGSPARVEINLRTRETVDLDGDRIEVDVKRLDVSIVGYAKGRLMGYGMTKYKPPKKQGVVEIHGAIGSLGLRREQVEEIDRIVARMKDTPEYRDFERRSAERRRQNDEYERGREKMRRVMGY